MEIKYKVYAPQLRSLDEENRTIDFVASTENIDRYGDIIRVKGWELENYLENPVFLWGHRSGDPPIGQAIKVWKESDPPALVHRIKFATKDEYPFADTIYKLYKGRFMRGVSVGFMPLKEPKDIVDKETKEVTGQEFISQELLELSAVSVPALPVALARAVTKGVITDTESRDFERFARSICGEDNPPWAYMTPGVTYSEDDTDAGAEGTGAEGKKVEPKHETVVRPTEQLRQFCDEGRRLAERFERKLDGISKAVKAGDYHDCPNGPDCPMQENGANPDEPCPDGENCPMNKPKSAEEIVVRLALSSSALLDLVGELGDSVRELKNIVEDGFDSIEAKFQLAFAELGTITAIAIPPESKSVCPYHEEDHAPDDYPWDAPAELAKCDTPEGWKRMSTVFEGDPDNKTSYKLPHHKGDDYATVKNGVSAALGRLEQTQMPDADRTGARSHLTKHQAEFASSANFDIAAFEASLAAMGRVYRYCTNEGLDGAAELLDAHIRAFVAEQTATAEIAPAITELPEPDSASLQVLLSRFIKSV